MGKVGSRVAPAAPHNSSCILSLQLTRDWSVGILMFQAISAMLHLGMSTTSRSLGVEHFQPPLDISGELYVSLSCISSLGSVQVSGVACHRSIQNSYSSGTLLDEGSLASHSSQLVGRHSLMVSHHKRPHHGYCSQLGIGGSAMMVAGMTWAFTTKIGLVGVLKSVYQTIPLLPLN